MRGCVSVTIKTVPAKWLRKVKDAPFGFRDRDHGRYACQASLDVCGELRASEQVDERAVTGCSFDSRAVSAGDVFFCKGAAFKTRVLSMALDAGAVAFVCEESLVESLEPLAKESGAAMLVVDSVRTAMALLPPEVYDRPTTTSRSWASPVPRERPRPLLCSSRLSKRRASPAA